MKTISPMLDGMLTLKWDDQTVFDEAFLTQGAGSLTDDLQIAVEARINNETILAERIGVAPDAEDLFLTKGQVADMNA